jgi:hypothetical protein
MRTRYFQDGSTDSPLIAIMDFDSAEVSELQASILAAAAGTKSAVHLGGEVSLSLIRGDRDIGIAVEGDAKYSCVLRPLTWHGIAGLLEPFKDARQSGHQWLDETGAIRLLISRNGQW